MFKTILTLLLIGSPLFGSLTSEEKEHLVKHAQAARNRAYAPYSEYKVGGALLTTDGTIIEGCNVENASYGLTGCAERSAIFAAVSRGHQQFEAIAVVTRDGGAPCGGCRQVLNEFNPQMIVIMADEKGNLVQETTLDQLLPNTFGPRNLSFKDDLLESTPEPLDHVEMVNSEKPHKSAPETEAI